MSCLEDRTLLAANFPEFVDPHPSPGNEFGKSLSILPNGNVVITAPGTDFGATDTGAVYMFNGTTGALISALYGSSAGDSIGTNITGTTSVAVLSTGNFLVRSPRWDNGAATDAGAVTFVNGVTGLNGVVSPANSLVGSAANDHVGTAVPLLSNGNYLVRTPAWDNGGVADVGAVTWASGTTGISGVITSANSLIGSQTYDQVGFNSVELANGNYLVWSEFWANGGAVNAGAVTWGRGTTGISGVVSPLNSLVGTASNDKVGGANAITLLPSGNYLVLSPNWDNGAIGNAGAITWGNATTGVAGAISSTNSLVGGRANDFVGSVAVTVLSNGNYLASTPLWDGTGGADAGAVTWGSGVSALTGVLGPANSLVGTRTGDMSGMTITQLASGNYVVNCASWDLNISAQDVGAVTWGSGAAGVSGAMGGAISLVGSIGGDQVGSGGITLLTNGNYVVASPLVNTATTTDVGAITWGSGTAGVKGGVTTVSLVGSTTDDMSATFSPPASFAITPLQNGNYVVRIPGFDLPGIMDAGAVTWVNGATGITGVVSAANSLVGSRASDVVGSGGLVELSNGNILIRSPQWDNGAAANNAGAVTWASGIAGVNGILGASNSLVGAKSLDAIGSGGIIQLTNGHYLVSSPLFHGIAARGGAVTWGSATTGISGLVSAANSLVGSHIDDRVGDAVTLLGDGNYLVAVPLWDNGANADAGSVTWGSASTGVAGVISASNSLVGSSANDQVGSGVAELSPGAYVVFSPLWDNGAAADAGAVTFGPAGVGVSGVVSAANSLVGSTAGDSVGADGVRKLINGNFVIRSRYWDNGAAVDAGAMTFGNGTTGVAGVVSASNSLVGSSTADQIGDFFEALQNGNYLIGSTKWDNAGVVDAGATTWVNGATGITGVISAANSLVGTHANDSVGASFTFELSNGNVLLRTPSWNGNAGAVTFMNGFTGLHGELSELNSLVGSTPGDQIGMSGLVELTNGNYLVRSANWDNGSAVNAGAVTWGDGAIGVKGVVSAANSLVGTTTDDAVGTSGYTLLPGGNYLVPSPLWDNGAAVNAGALTWGSGTTGVVGAIDATNSLVGSSTDDRVGSTSVTFLSNGNYFVRSLFWHNGGAAEAGALTFVNASTFVRGVISASNSLIGSSAGDKVGLSSIVEFPNGNFYVYNGNWDNGAVVDAGAVTWGSGTNGVVGEISATNSIVGLTGNTGFPLAVRLDTPRDQMFVGRFLDGHVYVVSQSSGLANIAPAGLNLTGATISLPELTSTLLPVTLGTLVPVDDYLGSNVFTLSGPDSSAFQVVGNLLQLRAGVSLDFETKSVYQVTVSLDDAAVGGQPDATLDFTLTITDSEEFEVSTPVDSDSAANSVAENTSNGAAVGITAFAFDADVTNNTVTYSLINDAGGRFQIDPASGVVTVRDLADIDFESSQTLAIVVKALSQDGSFATQSFDIAITDVDEFNVGSVSDTDPAANVVLEGAVDSTVVTGFLAVASDADGTTNAITYSLVDNAGGRFGIDPALGFVTVLDASLLDYETATSHTITVRATSEDGSFSDQAFTIQVADADEFNVSPITDTDPAPDRVPENSLTGTPVGVTAFASDADGTNNGITYSLWNTHSGRFAINPTTGVVTVANGALLNREAEASWAVTVLATSQDGSVSVKQFVVQITDVNEFKVGTVSDTNAAANSIVENCPTGTLVGITGLAVDPDATTNGVTYSLFNTRGGRFAIDPSTGVITVANGALIDREAAATWTLTIVATSQDGSVSVKDFTVSVQDVDEYDVGQVFDQDSSTNSVMETAPGGTAVGITGFGVDLDSTNNTITYSLTDNAGGRFAINPTTGVVTVAQGAALDRETNASWPITIQARSADGSVSTKVFTILLSDADEFAVGPISDVNTSTNAVSETAPAGTNVGITAKAVDPDATKSAVTYTLTNSAGGRFAINTTTGVITVGNPALLDREASGALPSYDVTVQAKSQDGSTSTKIFTIQITDSDEFDVGPVSDANAAANTVPENSPAGTLVGLTARATDADVSNNTITYSLTNNAGNRFQIDPATGVVSVMAGAALDFETQTSWDITVKATSSDGSFSTQTFTISLTNVFDAPRVTLSSNTVAENRPSGTVVGTLGLADSNATSPVYTLVTGTGSTDNSQFSITGNQLKTKASFNFESKSSYSIRVQMKGAGGVTVTQVFTILVTNVNEGPTGLTLSPASIAENNAVGATVGTLAGVDPDTGETLNYTLVSGTGSTDNAKFTIEGNQLKAAAVFDYETKRSYSIRVRVTDAAGLTYEKTLTISVTNGPG